MQPKRLKPSVSLFFTIRILDSVRAPLLHSSQSSLDLILCIIRPTPSIIRHVVVFLDYVFALPFAGL
jgi:hypothetical protein